MQCQPYLRSLTGPVLVLAYLLLVCAAWAQDPAPAPAPDPEAPPSPAGEPVAYTSADFGFSLSLPATGRILDPASEGWKEPQSVALWWLAAGNEPVKAIQVRVDEFRTELDETIFQAFCATLLSNWTENTERFAVYTRNAPLTFGGQTWNLIEVSDSAHPSKAVVYYSVFSAFKGSQIYIVTCYHMMPVNDAIRAFRAPVISSFSLAEGEADAG